MYVGKVRYAQFRNWEKKRRNGKNDKPLLVDGKHEAIIDSALWNRVSDRCKFMNHLPAWNYNGKNLLTGLLRCPECGGSMVISNTTNKLKSGTTRTRYYVCSKAKRHGGCHRNPIRADEVEKLVEMKLAYIISTPDIAEKVIERMDHERAGLVTEVQMIITNKQDDIKQVRQKLSKYDTLADDDDFKITQQIKTHQTMLENQITTLDDEIKTCQRRIESMSNTADMTSLNDLLEWVYAILQSDNRDYLKRIYAAVINQITFDKAQHTIIIQLRLNQAAIKQVSTYQQEAGVPLTGAPASLLSRELICVI
ncbi:zinc ribbon domain-containing protein [Lactiplantibacillus paraplantarum]|uniref:zinc ribbon domain-containing protein n=1 Tax=Lactiplantibacillus paraplantarum TaxID=60520 RepID=UPI0023AAAF4C|nr:zinc ribbon domain-containing protein [Lactiplantibacillus paraplantarum]WEE36060.1 zinc ribbon domain-containing protein [Lactiplantibacillus paraplantarum]